MGLFSKTQCDICEDVSGSIVKLQDGACCKNCFEQALFEGIKPKKERTIEEVVQGKEKKQQNQLKFNEFNATKEMKRFCIDGEKGQWYIKRGPLEKKDTPVVRSVKDINGFDIFEDGECITKKSSRKKGDKIFMLEVRVNMKSILDPIVKIPLNDGMVKKDSIMYNIGMKEGHEIISILSHVTSSKEEVKQVVNQVVNQPVSMADEIMKYKQLLDMGAISQEEFDQKKEELLNN